MSYKWECAGDSRICKNDDSHYCDVSMGLVADGVGGKKRGDVASNIAVDEGRKKLQEMLASEPNEEDVSLSIERVFKELGVIVYREGAKDITKANMQSTLTLAVRHGDNAYIASIGDSPAFVFEDGKLRKVTIEDSYLMRKIDESASEEEIFRRIHSEDEDDYLLNSLGIEEEIEANLYDPIPLKGGQYFVLLTDGAAKLVMPTELESILKQDLSPEEVVQRILDIVSDPIRVAEILGKDPKKIANKDDATVVVFRSIEEN